MPLPLKTFKVFPNPWALIHHELGPQAALSTDNGGRDNGPVRFVGAVRSLTDSADKRESLAVRGVTITEPVADGTKALFRFPGLKPDFLGGEPVDVPASSGYYRHALENGDLVPADERTAATVKCKFRDLRAAKEAGVAKFEADHDKGSWIELEGLLAAEAKAPKPVAIVEPNVSVPQELKKKPAGGID